MNREEPLSSSQLAAYAVMDTPLLVFTTLASVSTPEHSQPGSFADIDLEGASNTHEMALT